MPFLARATEVRVFTPLRRRPFFLLWSGQSLSHLGDGVAVVALPWLVFDLTGSAAAMGVVMTLNIAPMLALLLVGGVVVDRLPRRRILLVSDAARAAVAGTIAGLVVTQRVELWHVLTLSAVFGAVAAFFQPAYSSVVPELVPPAELAAANSLLSSSRSLASVVGPLLGAILVAIGGNAAAFAFDGVTFAISTLCLAAIGNLTFGQPRAGGGSVRGELAEGFRVVAASTWLWFTIALWSCIAALTLGLMSVALPQLVREQLGGDVASLGLLQSAASLGLVVGGLTIGQLGVPRRRGLWLYGGSAVRGVALALLGLTPSLVFGSVLCLVFGLMVGVILVVWVASVQELVPAHLLGRVYSIDLLGSYALLPLGYFGTGMLVESLGAAPVFVAGGLGVAVLSAAGLLVPSIRRF